MEETRKYPQIQDENYSENVDLFTGSRFNWNNEIRRTGLQRLLECCSKIANFSVDKDKLREVFTIFKQRAHRLTELDPKREDHMKILYNKILSLKSACTKFMTLELQKGFLKIYTKKL